MKLIVLLFLSLCIQLAFAEPVVLCDVSKGLSMLDQDSYSQSQMDMILRDCDKVSPNDPEVSLLHGLVARKNKNYNQAVISFQRAQNLAPQNVSPALELAATYELLKELAKASQLYQSILAKNPQNRGALLGQARIFRLQSQYNQSVSIYQNLLITNPHDIDALNGLGWIHLAKSNLPLANNFFKEILSLQPENLEALLALKQIKQTELQQSPLCNASNGLILLNQEKPIFSQINNIITQCEQNKIVNGDTQLLSGLLARKEGNNVKAIHLLTEAMKTAPNNDYRAALELATTYEWGKHPAEALMIYQSLLKKEPVNRPALLGKARVLRLEGKFAEALAVYQQLELKNSKDIDVLNGLGWLKFAEKNYKEAANYFHNTLAIQSINKEALIALGQIKSAETGLAHNSACKVMLGLQLLNQKNPPLNEIASILEECWKKKNLSAEDFLLQGLLARYKARNTKNYSQAIYWLQKARQVAEPHNFGPALELAVTYEWAMQPKQAEFIYEAILAQDKNNQAALSGKARVLQALSTPPVKPSLCDADKGLILLNQQNPPLPLIKTILARCDRNTKNDPTNLLLHGLLARYLAKDSKEYEEAIKWLQLADNNAEPGSYMAAYELAVTYEWSGKAPTALLIYENILLKKPKDRVALLGKARVLRSMYEIKSSLAIYQRLLRRSPNDIEALNGLGEVYLTNYQFTEAKEILNKVLVLDPKNKQTTDDMRILNGATKNILSLTTSNYKVPPNESQGYNMYYFRNLNATDGLTVIATHNTKEIDSGFGMGSALLPSNSLLLGYQHIIPKKYSYQFSYDARQHNKLPFEHRTYTSLNLFVHKNLEWFGGVRLAFLKPWNTQLLISGATLYTSLPVNITATGFWAFQEIGGKQDTYALDLTKEYNNRLYYDIGSSYLIQQKSWEVHGKLIYPVFRNQALIAEGSHYFFNRSTFITAGWRIYWA